MVGRELLRGAVVDESLVEQPLDGPALGSNITQGVPRRNQFGVVFMDLVLESSERSSPLQRLGQAPADRDVAEAVGKVGHVPKPHIGRERIDGDEIELVDLDGVLPVDARVGGPEHHLTGSRVDEPSVLVVSLIRERGGDLLNVDSAQVEHLLRLEPEPGVLEEPHERRRGCRPARGGKTTSWVARIAANPGERSRPQRGRVGRLETRWRLGVRGVLLVDLWAWLVLKLMTEVIAGG